MSESMVERVAKQLEGRFGTPAPIETPFGRLVINPGVPPDEIWVLVNNRLAGRIVNPAYLAETKE